jgi:haloalkane dehalogenase
MAPGHPSWDELVATENALQRFRDLPTLLCWGERDWCFTPRFREEWQERFPDARCVRFDDAGHYVWEDAGERAVLALAEFLESTAGALPVPAAPEGSVRA